jgi:archaemetzincin
MNVSMENRNPSPATPVKQSAMHDLPSTTPEEPGEMPKEQPATSHCIVISKIGNFETELLDPISHEIGRIFGYPTDIVPILDDVEFALNADRNQYHSTPILESLAIEAPPHAFKILAITDLDLFIPILTHVYGEAQLGGKASIISTFRLRDGLSPLNLEKTFLTRVIKEAIHELGHTFKLQHCKDHACIMHYCRNERDVDRKSDQLCRYCKILLQDEIKRAGGTTSHQPGERNMKHQD